MVKTFSRSRFQWVSGILLTLSACSTSPTPPVDAGQTDTLAADSVADIGPRDVPASEVPASDTAPAIDTACANPDQDGDGHRSIACGGDDCDDNDPHRYPGNTEVCAVEMVASDAGTDGGAPGFTLTRTDPAHGLDPAHDEDCDPTTFANGTTLDGDHDGDGYIDVACLNRDTNGMAHGGTDCADLEPVMSTATSHYNLSVMPNQIHPDQTEVCNGVDDNCNGAIDEGLPVATYYLDSDGDGYGETSMTISACMAISGYASHGGDCNDMNASIYPGATEVCDGLDDNCNGLADYQIGPNNTEDDDMDHYADIACGAACTGPQCGDCNDNDPTVHPNATEICNGVDNNCNGQADNVDPLATAWCGDPPNVPVSAVSCNGTACAFGTCTAPYADCNMMFADGCEINTATDPHNCGACGYACGAGLMCIAGRCSTGTPGARKISASGGTTCVRTNTGGVMCWGVSGGGMLGNGAGLDSATPVSAGAFTDASSVALGGYACAVHGSGTAACWGPGLTMVPVDQAMPANVAQMAPGSGTTWCAIDTAGTVTCAPGIQYDGSVHDAIDIAVNGTNACALHGTGVVSCWGGASGTPAVVTVAPLVSLSPAIGCGVSATATIACWVGTAPVLTGVAEVAGTPGSGCARMTDGTVQCWGDNSVGELGDGTTTTRATAAPVTGVTGSVGIAMTAYTNACSLDATGAVKCWGSYRNGNLGDGESSVHLTNVQASTTAVDIGDDNGLTIVSSSGTESGSLASYFAPLSGIATAAGEYGAGCVTFTNGTFSCYQYPNWTPVSGVSGAVRAAYGTNNGQGFFGAALLGNGEVIVSATSGVFDSPARFADGSIQDPESTANPIRNATKISSVTSGQGGVAIVRANGRIFACGEATPYNDMGNSGGEVPAVTDAIDVGTDSGTLCFVHQTGGVSCFGFGDVGQNGNGAPGFAYTDDPANVSGITNATNVWGGGSHECARLATGAVQCWGVDSSGELGDGARVTQRNSPVNCSALPSGFNVVQMALGYGYSCARDNTGRVVCWGQSANGAFGIALPYFSTAAVSVMGLP